MNFRKEVLHEKKGYAFNCACKKKKTQGNIWIYHVNMLDEAELQDLFFRLCLNRTGLIFADYSDKKATTSLYQWSALKHT